MELSGNTVAFISYRCRLTKVLASATRGEKGSGSGGSRVKLLDVDTGRLVRLKNKLVYRFKLATDVVLDCIRELVNDTDGPAFLGRELMGLGLDVDGYR